LLQHFQLEAKGTRQQRIASAFIAEAQKASSSTISSKCQADCVLEHERRHSDRFSAEWTKNETYCKFLKDNLKPVIMAKRRGLLFKGVSFQSPHASLATGLTFEELSKSPPIPPYSSGVNPRDFHTFEPLKTALGGIHFRTDQEVQCAVQNWLLDKQKYVHDGVMALKSLWKTCIEK
jgi:hypothetical protein